ncbi:bifunctional PIG-L family deacetylase/class I SAM-dependent methyltransferase [Salegentibacter sp. Hel_I_6]|uniref:bifunctional PIG-L family deacetylase/class I SAM-dependent methyltransferase n=1 Tax=Salegentibacter sp. Hel_I_6 TaxID=1250278 RepID=UPI0005653900|nr:bifunctional PIG-L family deacetylase/class I SAM-dependent methyltransferase [Salegentibacter sp. Hel_I_6]
MTSFIQDFEKIPHLNIEGLYRDLGTVMVVAPHPDDESLGCGGIIAHLREQNAEVWVLFMTNGEASHQNSVTYPPKKLGSLRTREAEAACQILGVPKDHLLFLNAGDGKLKSYLQANSSILHKLTKLFQQKEIDTLFVPWRRDHHIDHLATSSLVRKAAGGLGLIIVEYPIWLWKKGTPEDWPKQNEILPFKLAIDSVKDKKHKAIMAHSSQTSTLIEDDPEGFILTEELLAPFLGNCEYFFFPSENKSAVTKTYFDELYAKDIDPWDFEKSAYEQEKYKNTLHAISQRKIKKALEIGCANGVFTALFAPHCKELIALELNESALENARKRCSQFSQCEFLQWDIAGGLPEGDFDAILLSEVGYYFQKDILHQIFKNIDRVLLPGGVFIMVHWTAYVRNYPLTGLQVHEIFEKNHSGTFKKVENQRYELYELVVWEKTEK